MEIVHNIHFCIIKLYWNYERYIKDTGKSLLNNKMLKSILG